MKKLFLIIFWMLNMLYTHAQMQRDSSLESVLELSIEELMNTQVNIATKVNNTVKESPAVVTVITRKMIENFGARDIYDVLQYIPGFEFSVPRAAFYSIGIRGVKDPLTNPRLLFLKDGVSFNGVMYGTGLAIGNQLDVNTIERIEIIRGPGSALYGRNAFSGVINVITREATKSDQVETYAKLGNFNTYSLGASYGIVKNELHAIFSVDRIKSDRTDSKFDNGKGGESTWNIYTNNWHLNTKVHYKSFELNVLHSNIDVGASIGPFINNSGKNILFNIYSLDYKLPIGKNSLGIKVYGRNENQTQNIVIFEPGITAEAAPGVTFGDIYPNGAYATPSFKAYTYGTDINLALNTLRKNQLLIGMQTDFYGLNNVLLKSSYDTYSPASTPLSYVNEEGNIVFRGKDDQIIEERGWIEGDGHDYSNLAFYVQNIFTPVNQMQITIGARYDIDSEVGGVFNPRLALVWNVVDNLILKAMYGEAYRAPTANEQYRLTGFTRGNKNLEPEKIQTSELSVDYALTENLANRITLFYNALSDMIYSESSATGVPDTTYTNIGQNTSYGIEYELNAKLGLKAMFYANYSYNFSEDEVKLNNTVDTYPHRDVAPHKVNAGINYAVTKKINLNTNIIYRSTREKYSRLNSENEMISISQDNVGNFILVNTKIRWKNVFPNAELSGEVFNLFDTEYFDQDNRNSYQPAREGRQFIFTLKYTI